MLLIPKLELINELNQDKISRFVIELLERLLILKVDLYFDYQSKMSKFSFNNTDDKKSITIGLSGMNLLNDEVSSVIKTKEIIVLLLHEIGHLIQLKEKYPEQDSLDPNFIYELEKDAWNKASFLMRYYDLDKELGATLFVTKNNGMRYYYSKITSTAWLEFSSGGSMKYSFQLFILKLYRMFNNSSNRMKNIVNTQFINLK